MSKDVRCYHHVLIGWTSLLGQIGWRNMRIDKLNSAIRKYSELRDADPEQFAKDIEERNERARHYQSFDAKAIRSFDEEAMIEYLGKLWALRMWGNKRYKVLEVIEGTGFENLKNELIDLLYGVASLDVRWDAFLTNVKGLGYAAASELLAYISPSECMIYNGTTNSAFEYFDIPLVSKYAYQRTGKLYLEVCAAAKDILGHLAKANLPAEDLLAVDYFFWDVVRLEPMQSAAPAISEAEQPVLRSKSLHNEVRDSIVEIGKLLGFESRSEVKVASGAVVDAVWEAKIGNMGRAMYVFEVQDSGSIDSLILNLMRAQSNAAVQAIVAVSDAQQLEKIRIESESIFSDGVLRAWESDDVLNTYNHLALAHDSINALNLVPESF
ncbi:hypothetical protein [Gordonibacter massiliensis (ex Traore et al. 2017)]|uniref:hypothetical protein n=1 Tax=Gordonibacter massiliensis (ex Traore et al. 2017) TaxID=1841863 RepID=UPI001C8BB42C|nr:hypothetical protein [Gordonibacter massiliensis (ex Traore et al. 2017)]